MYNSNWTVTCRLNSVRHREYAMVRDDVIPSVADRVTSSPNTLRQSHLNLAVKDHHVICIERGRKHK
jgi:hypothetical protein